MRDTPRSPFALLSSASRLAQPSFPRRKVCPSDTSPTCSPGHIHLPLLLPLLSATPARPTPAPTAPTCTRIAVPHACPHPTRGLRVSPGCLAGRLCVQPLAPSTRRGRDPEGMGLWRGSVRPVAKLSCLRPPFSHSMTTDASPKGSQEQVTPGFASALTRGWKKSVD